MSPCIQEPRVVAPFAQAFLDGQKTKNLSTSFNKIVNKTYKTINVKSSATVIFLLLLLLSMPFYCVAKFGKEEEKESSCKPHNMNLVQYAIHPVTINEGLKEVTKLLRQPEDREGIGWVT